MEQKMKESHFLKKIIKEKYKRECIRRTRKNLGGDY